MTNTDVLLLVLVLLLPGALLYLLIRNKIKPRLFSPVYALVFYYAISSLCGVLYYSINTAYKGSFYDLGVDNSALFSAFCAILMAVLAFMVGVCVYLYSFGAHDVRVPMQAVSTVPEPLSVRRNIVVVYYACSFIPLALIIIGVGPDNLLDRFVYMDEAFHWFKIAGIVLSFFPVILSGYMTFAEHRLRKKYKWVVIAVLYQGAYFALATRAFAFCLVLFFVGAILARYKSRLAWCLLLTVIVALPLTIQIPLISRGMAEQGLVPFLKAIGDGSYDQALSGYFGLVGDLIRNVAFSVPLTAYVWHAPQLGINELIASIQPLPSLVTPNWMQQWQYYQPAARVSDYIPYNTLGELLNHGIALAVLYYFAVGFVFAYFDVRIRHRIAGRKIFICVLLIATAILFVILSTEYNLRSATRLIYYMMVFELLYRSYRTLRRKAKSVVEPI